MGVAGRWTGSDLRRSAVGRDGPSEQTSDYYWRLDTDHARIVDPGSTVTEFPLGHSLGHDLGVEQADKLDLLFPLDQVGGDPRNAKFTLEFRGRSPQTEGGVIRVLAKLSTGVESYVDLLGEQHTQIIFSALLPDEQFVEDSTFLDVGRVDVTAEADCETSLFSGESVAKLDGENSVMWIRLVAGSPGIAATNEVDLSDISLLCHFVDYPAPPSGPMDAVVGDDERLRDRQHGQPRPRSRVSVALSAVLERPVGTGDDRTGLEPEQVPRQDVVHAGSFPPHGPGPKLRRSRGHEPLADRSGRPGHGRRRPVGDPCREHRCDRPAAGRSRRCVLLRRFRRRLGR